MKAKVSDGGLVLPKELFGGIEEVEVRKEDDVVTIAPAPGDDPILGLGEHPVPCGAPDASERHDRYLDV